CVRCHSGGGSAGVDLDSYAGVLANADLLIAQLEANHQNGPDDAGFVVILAQWIDEGALDN
ncbi:MAG: hypothetical protein HKN97_08090, partial [Myxococcales bacterium]|nr:hypothetical protein [Myxococcales bacterium]